MAQRDTDVGQFSLKGKGPHYSVDLQLVRQKSQVSAQGNFRWLLKKSTFSYQARYENGHLVFVEIKAPGFNVDETFYSDGTLHSRRRRLNNSLVEDGIESPSPEASITDLIGLLIAIYEKGKGFAAFDRHWQDVFPAVVWLGNRLVSLSLNNGVVFASGKKVADLSVTNEKLVLSNTLLGLRFILT